MIATAATDEAIEEAKMKSPLLNPVTKRFADHSTAKSFSFSFFCDQCDKEWRSVPQAFRMDSLKSPVNLRIVGMLWNDQHKAAYERANLEAIYVFYYCPECGRRVCVECFCQSEMDFSEACKNCVHTTAVKKTIRYR